MPFENQQYVTPAGLQAMGIEYSRQWLYALEQRGDFPKRLFYSPRKYHWLRSDIERWLSERHATAQPTIPPSHGTTIADDLKSLTPNDHAEAAHVAEPA